MNKRARTSRAKLNRLSISLINNGGAYKCTFREETCGDPTLLSWHILKAHTKAFNVYAPLLVALQSSVRRMSGEIRHTRNLILHQDN